MFLTHIQLLLCTEPSVAETHSQNELETEEVIETEEEILPTPTNEIVEEAIFIGVLRRFIKNNKLFIITSAIILGLLHTMSEAILFYPIVMAISYAILGRFLLIYTKTENISCNILAHCFQNKIASIIMSITECIVM